MAEKVKASRASPIGTIANSPALERREYSSSNKQSPVGTVESHTFNRPDGTHASSFNFFPGDKSPGYRHSSLQDFSNPLTAALHLRHLRQPPHLAFHHLALEHGRMVDEDDAVAVVGFVQQAARG